MVTSSRKNNPDMPKLENGKIEIYTDGSCLGNPGPGGWAAVIHHGEETVEISGNEKESTNNRMEMTAIIRALQWVRENFPDKLNNLKIILYSDSNLLVQSLNQGWKRKANTDLWAKMDKARAWLDIEWTWVKAHHTNKYNNRADELAFNEANKAKA